MEDKSRTIPYPIRMPAELRAQLEDAAKVGNRSLHAEIIARLQSTFTTASHAAMSANGGSAGDGGGIGRDEEIEGLRRLAALTYELQRANLKVDLFRNRLSLAWHDTQDKLKTGTKEEAASAKAIYMTLNDEMQRYVDSVAAIEEKISEIHLQRKVSGLKELRDVEPVFVSVRGGPMQDIGVVIHDASKQKPKP
jgi:hypothetical protein